MTVTATVTGTRRQQGEVTFVACEYKHVESGLTKTYALGFPVGINVIASCTALIPAVEVLLKDQEKTNQDRRVRNNGIARAEVVVVINTLNAVLAYILEQAFAAEDGVTADKYNDFLQEFTDAEIAAALPLDETQAATWKANSAANSVVFATGRAYSPLA